MTLDFREVIPGKVAYAPRFLPELDSTWLLQWIRQTSSWSQERLSIKGGVSVPFPRLVAWHGDEGIGYRYSGIEHPAKPWTEPLAIIHERVCETFGGPVPNGVLLNYYRDGNDSIGRHADREDDLVPGSTIFGVSLGETRRIRFRRMDPDVSDDGKRTWPTVDLDLEDGSILLMYGDCQRTWTHEIKKQRDLSGERISLTFRTVKT